MFRSLTAASSALLPTAAVASTETPSAAANVAGPIASARITLKAAVAVAEKHANGKAVRAQCEKQKDGSWIYDVEVKADTRVTHVKVDPDKGAVAASTADQADHDDDGDKAD